MHVLHTWQQYGGECDLSWEVWHWEIFRISYPESWCQSHLDKYGSFLSWLNKNIPKGSQFLGLEEMIKEQITVYRKVPCFLLFSKWNHMGELKPKAELHTICTNNPPKKFSSFVLFFNIAYKWLRWESRSYSYSRSLPHVVLSVSKAGIKIHTDNCLREEAKFSFSEKPHVPSVSAQPERHKWTESHVSLQSKQNTDFRSFSLQNTG